MPEIFQRPWKLCIGKTHKGFRYRVDDGETQHDIVCILGPRSLGLNGQGHIGARGGLKTRQEGHRAIRSFPSFQLQTGRGCRVKSTAVGGSDAEVSSCTVSFQREGHRERRSCHHHAVWIGLNTDGGCNRTRLTVSSLQPACDTEALRWPLTEMLRLEDLKLVDDCRWKTMGAPEPSPLSRPFTRTKNSADGIFWILTRKLVPSCGSTTPLISSEPNNSTRETSVTVALSLPVTDTSKLTLAPRKKINKYTNCRFHDDISTSAYDELVLFFFLPGRGRVSRTSNPWKRPPDSSTKSNRKSRRLSPTNWNQFKQDCTNNSVEFLALLCLVVSFFTGCVWYTECSAGQILRGWNMR